WNKARVGNRRFQLWILDLLSDFEFRISNCEPGETPTVDVAPFLSRPNAGAPMQACPRCATGCASANAPRRLRSVHRRCPCEWTNKNDPEHRPAGLPCSPIVRPPGRSYTEMTGRERPPHRTSRTNILERFPMAPSRRDFLKSSSALVLGSWAASLSPSLRADEKKPQPLYKISCTEYSLHRMIAKGEIDNLAYAEFVKKEFDLDGVEYWNRPFFDKAKDQKYIGEMRKRAD